MKLGIDASNIRGSGGGVTHLVQLLANIRPIDFGFEEVYVWAEDEILNLLPVENWLVKKTCRKTYGKLLWQIFARDEEFKTANCDIMFFPGGTYGGSFRPFVTMSQNMLPFELNEAKRFGVSLTYFRYLILRWFQIATFKRANGLVFLTEYARQQVLKKVEISLAKTVVIPHGIEKGFGEAVRDYTSARKILYVSIINFYKHQGNVVCAISKLRSEGYPVELILIGPAYTRAMKDLNSKLSLIVDSKHYIFYLGKKPREELLEFYRSADLFVFASSCENMPIILLEAMNAGLPIACSDKGPMKEVLLDGGVYFNPESIEDIYYALKELVSKPVLRKQIGCKAKMYASKYTWQNTAAATFKYLYRVAERFKT